MHSPVICHRLFGPSAIFSFHRFDQEVTLAFLSAFKAEPSLLFFFFCLTNGNREREGEGISFRPFLHWPFRPFLFPSSLILFFIFFRHDDRLSTNSNGSVLLMQERASGEERHMFMTHDVRHRGESQSSKLPRCSLLAECDITKN